MELVVLAFWGVIFLTVSVFYMKKLMFMLVDSEITFFQGIGYFVAYFILFILFFGLPLIFKIFIIVIVGGFNFAIEPIKRYINKEENKSLYLRKIMKCDEAYLLNPSDWGLLSMKAYYYSKIKDYEKAVEIQTKVVELSKKDLNEIGKLNSYRKWSGSVELSV